MQANLTDLINTLTFGTKLHISVVFFGEHGNALTALPNNLQIHKTDVCDKAKALYQGYDRCFRCRNIVLKRVTRTQKPLWGSCINGIFEYCHPVIQNGEVVCVVFIGNILSPDNSSKFPFEEKLKTTLQEDFSLEDCKRTACILENYITLLLKTGNEQKGLHDPLANNIKAYLKENLCTDIRMSDLAYFFGYNEKYLGRKFQLLTGYSVKEYVNRLRISLAKELLNQKVLKISEISERAGFNNVTYFNKLFKKATGITPAEYRKQRTEA